MTATVSTVVNAALHKARTARGAPLVIQATPYCSTPLTLLAGLASSSIQGADHRDRLEVGLLIGAQQVAEAVRDRRLELSTWHPHGALRSVVEDGHASYLRLRASEVLPRLRGRVDVALVRVGPPDKHGLCSVGPSGTMTQALIASARMIVAEIDPTFPRIGGPAALIRRDQLDIIVDTDTTEQWPISQVATPAMSAAAALVTALIPPRATVQLGIGALPDAVGMALAASDHRNLKVIGVASRPIVRMLESGVALDHPASVRVVEILGQRDVLDYFHNNPALSLHSSTTMHDPQWLGRIPALVSVCTGLLIDEQANVASERVGSRVVSGIGGSVDFIEGARRSDGGLAIMVFTATGPVQRSRLVERLKPCEVTIPGCLIDVVVTEYGIADLRGIDDAERATRLRAVFHAAPSETPIVEDDTAGLTGAVNEGPIINIM